MRNVKIITGESIGKNYPTDTGRLLQIGKPSGTTKIAFIGGSTLDNSTQVNQNKPHAKRTDTVSHQTAAVLAKVSTDNYTIANFAIDSATGYDLLDHSEETAITLKQKPVKPLEAALSWQPEILVLSIGGKSYHNLVKKILAQQTLNSAKQSSTVVPIDLAYFTNEFLEEYQHVIERILNKHASNQCKTFQRLILVSPYCPKIATNTPYSIYTGFSPTALSPKEKETVVAIQKTIETVCQGIINHLIKMDKGVVFKKVVFIDAASSISPLLNHCSTPTKPNTQGARIIGKLIAKAVNHKLIDQNKAINKTTLKLSPTDSVPAVLAFNEDKIEKFKITPLQNLISKHENYRVATSYPTSFAQRLRNTYSLFAGTRSDPKYLGPKSFTLGILDISIVTIFAAYLWRHAVDEEQYQITRGPAALVAALFLVPQAMIAAFCTLALSPLVGIIHLFIKLLYQPKPVADFTIVQTTAHDSKQELSMSEKMPSSTDSDTGSLNARETKNSLFRGSIFPLEQEQFPAADVKHGDGQHLSCS